MVSAVEGNQGKEGVRYKKDERPVFFLKASVDS